MNPSANNSAATGAEPATQPVATLRDQLTQTLSAASRLKSILAPPADPPRGVGEQQ